MFDLRVLGQLVYVDAAPDLLRLPDREPVGVDEDPVTIPQSFSNGTKIVEGTYALGSQRHASPLAR